MPHDQIFVLVLLLEQYQDTNIMEQTLCGRKLPEWVETAVAPFAHKTVTVSANDDIITIFKANLPTQAYTVVTYADMPLMTTQTIEEAVDYCNHKNVPAVKLPRGWVFNTAAVAHSEHFPVTEFNGGDPTAYVVAFNYLQLAKCRSLLQARINEQHLKNGVQIIDPSHTYIDASVQIDANVLIEPNVHLIGNTTVHANTKLLDGTHVTDAVIGADCQIGPYAHLRSGTSIGDGCRLGNYVEVKRSQIGAQTKIDHMSYVGDVTLGTGCKIGCGVIFCNYNGKVKSNTTLGADVFIGSNTCLVAPLQIGDKAFIAAGSVITETVPARALGIARARQALKADYVTD